MILRTFGWPFGVTVAGLALAFAYGGPAALAIAAILAVLEISLSFDNAVVNATVLERMNPFWQKIFLTVGIAIAVFGMRILFPLLIVGITAKLSPVEAVQLALRGGSVHESGSYANVLHEAHPAIAAFGGMFLLMLFLDFIFEDRDISWLRWLERPLARVGKLDQLSVIVALLALVITAETLAPESKISTVALAGILGLVTYVLVNGLGELFEAGGEDAEDDERLDLSGTSSHDIPVAKPVARSRTMAKAAGKAAFFLFLYLEVLDASFSFDGVIGAFAITSDPIVIAIGLGIGAMYIRSLTVYLVRRQTLDEYVYLEHGAHWAIGALAVLLLVSIKFEVPELVTGLIGVGFIAAAFVSSLVRNRRADAEPKSGHLEKEPVGAGV
jgi:hypothetical protein